MNDQPAQDLSPNKQALLKIRELKQRIAELQQQQSAVSEPIAIVSMACRFPRRSNTPEKFWQSLIDQTDEVSEIPVDRWDLSAFHDDNPEIPGRMYARHGVFLDNLDQMDPEFFGISPREATWVDPQQRLLMEVGWEALERAAWVPETIGERTGVFVGWMHNDYQNEASDSFLNLNPYIATGAAGSFLCGRLAYYLGLKGPSVAVDTACSSSLVALHLACLSLQQRDCDRALVGGVNAICSPTTNILTCKLKALSPTGQSRAFDAAADGYLRGEGCGVITLRRLKDAERDGDPIIGVIKGSAIGHNGSGGGLTVPNPKAQEQVIRDALRRAQISPHDVQYLEAHGTGTELGDPIELQAAAAALAPDRNGSGPLLVGSVKTNIGHLEAAAGMAGLIKVLLAIQNDRIPGQLNFETPNPHIPWDRMDVRVLTGVTEWPGDHRVAGVSAFGMSGTNAHAIIAAPETTTPLVSTASESRRAEEPQLITLSARTDEALRDLAEDFSRDDFQNEDLADVAYTTTVGRSHFEHRAAVVASTYDEAKTAFQTIARSGRSDNVVEATAKRPPKVAWQFTGQGSQYPGMSQELYDNEPVFRDAIDHCDKLLQEWRGESLKHVLFEHEDLVNHTSWTQPAIFAVQMGLAKLLQSRGLMPDVVLGHSVGQYAAACVAEIMTWDDGLKLIAERGRLIGELPPGGLMLAVFESLPDVREWLKAFAKADVSLAAINGTHIVVSGRAETVEELESHFTADGRRCKRLATSHAFHSELMQPALEPFRTFAEQIEFAAPQIPLVCNISGEVLAANSVTDAAYWSSHIRQPVAFANSIDKVQELGCDLILELGPQGHLTRMAAANWNGKPENLVTCLDRNTADRKALLMAIGRLHVNGARVDFQAMHVGQNRRPVQLPTYPFQRRRFWGPDKPRADHAEFHTAHPLLGQKLSLAGISNETRYESFVESDSPPWLPDHEVMGQTILPGAAFVEMAIAACGTFPSSVAEIRFEQPFSPKRRTALQTIVRKVDDNENIETFSAGHDGSWTRHFTAKKSTTESIQPLSADHLETLKAELPEASEPSDFYAKMSEIGLSYGPAFQTIREIRFSEDRVLTRLETSGDVRGFHIAPTLLDGALHSLAVGLLRQDDGNLFLPTGIDAVVCSESVPSEVWCEAVWIDNEGEERSANLTLFAESGEVFMTITGLRVKQVSRSVLRQMSGAGIKRLLYEIRWEDFRLPEKSAESQRWLVVGDDQTAVEVAANLIEAGHEVRRATADDLCTGVEVDEMDGVAWLLCDDTAANCKAILSLVGQLTAGGPTTLRCGLNLLTQNGVAVGDDDGCRAEQAKYWGLGRVLGAEQPTLRCRLLDFSDAASAVSDIAAFLQTETRDNQLALRKGQFFAPRLKSIARNSETKAIEWKPNERETSYLITGGLGKLGRQAAKWLADNGAGQVVLVSRRQPDEETQSFLEAIAATGCDVVIHNADISSRDDVALLFERFGQTSPDGYKPLAGIIHAAGVLDDGLMTEQTWERFEKVLAPKVKAAKLLDEFSRNVSLDFFILYSSVAAVLGSRGQSNYATGNAFLDGLAWQRRAAALPATSINWGPWVEGMADDERVRRQMTLQGITPLSVDEAHQCMEQMLTNNTVQATVLDVDWRRMQMGMGGESPPLLEGVAPARQKSQMGDSAFVGKLKQLRGNAQRELLVTTIQELLQQIFSTSDAPETDRPLIEMGLDSLMAVEFSTQLQMMLGEAAVIAPTMLFDHPTIDAISTHVLEMLDDSQAAEETPSRKQAKSSDSADTDVPIRTREPIAIIGMSCRFPGAHDVDEFWDNLINGVDSVGEIPSDRWDIERFYDADGQPGKMYTREGGFLDDIGDFDPTFFNISEQEACWIDPQHRMLLENSYRALEDAGIPSAPLEDRNVGVYMGIMGQDYAFLPRLEDSHIVEAFEGAGLSHSAGVGRISYVFGFEGPSIAVDTASSSSLVAVNQAMRSLQDGNCNLALAGGVNAILAPVNSLLMSKAGLLAPDGRCKSFSAAADGFGRGEGCGVVVLKRLSDARQDGDRVMAVIRGGAVVHNGFTGGITSPSGKAQARVISEALQDAKIAPSQVQYLEAHGTGTEFGDPMEIGAAAGVLGKGRKRDNPLLVGTVKGNISHLEAAGGISGLIKTTLCLDKGVIPPQVHFEEPSPHVPWKRLPVKVVTEETPWPETDERIAGVTALGLVGTNAHVVLSSVNDVDEPAAEENEQSWDDDRSELLVLSARSDDALSEQVRSFENFLRENEDVDLADACFSASTGRRHFEHRFAVNVSSREDALEKLTAFHGKVRMVCIDRSDYSIDQVSGTPKIAWLFDGEQANTTAARQLFRTEPAFREFVVACDERIKQDGGSANALQHWLESDPGSNGVDALSQAVRTFVLQSGIASVFRSWGIEPDVVAGFGVGQYVAACVAGCLCFKDALALLIKREEVLSDNISEEEFEAFADGFNYYPPNMPLVCSLSGTMVPVHKSLGGSYWREHIGANSKQFESMQTVAAEKCSQMIDMSLGTRPEEGQTAISEDLCDVSAALSPERTADESMRLVAGKVYTLGANIAFAAMYAGRTPSRIRLPHYPFQKKRYWITEIEQHVGT